MKRMKFGSIFTMFLGLVALMSGLAGCEDKITEGEIPVDNEKLVTVPLAFDFAPETDGYEIASGSRYNRLQREPVPQVLTRDVTELTPDALYNLEIRQYNSAGTHLAGTTFAQATIGTALDVTLQVSDDCQLVIVTRGDGKTVKTELGTRTLQKVQENITADSTVISRINPTDQSSMNKMPYVLHLKHVKVVQESGKYII
nr:hypothetical protein [Bacteroides intestinalis]